MKHLPYMEVLHYVESWRMSRRYFLRLHSISVRKLGKYELPGYIITSFGVPPFLVTQPEKYLFKSLGFYLKMGNQYV